MGLTILEAAKSEENPQRLAVIAELAEGELMRSLPFMPVDGPGVDYGVEAELPSVGFRGFNEAYSDSYGVINPQYERLKIFGGDIDVDLARMRMNGAQSKLDQIQMKVRSMRMTFEDYFINGDESVEPRAFDGLKKRINVGSSQAIDEGGALSLASLDELLDAVEGDDKVLIMNKKMRRRLSAASRDTTKSGFIMFELDEFGRRVTMYGDARIIVTDKNNTNEDIQAFNEGSGANTTSVYCVSFGDLRTTALQHSAGIIIDELGQVDDAPVDRTRLEWYVGAAIFNGRSAARLYGITDAAVTV